MPEVLRANYRMRLAADNKDLRAAQLLRFVVFNLELREGLEQSYATCLDADAYDSVCDHLLVEDMRTGEVIGTYRLQTGQRAAENRGYYSAQEFDFTPFEPLRHEIRASRNTSRSAAAVTSWVAVRSLPRILAWASRLITNYSAISSRNHGGQIRSRNSPASAANLPRPRQKFRSC